MTAKQRKVLDLAGLSFLIVSIALGRILTQEVSSVAVATMMAWLWVILVAAGKLHEIQQRVISTGSGGKIDESRRGLSFSRMVRFPWCMRFGFCPSHDNKITAPTLDASWPQVRWLIFRQGVTLAG